MIIPKAIFLHYKYRQSQCGQFDSVKQEIQRVMGQLVIELRNPDVHQHGEICCFFAAEQYPRLSQEKNTDSWETTWLSAFTQAGYHIDVQHSETGFSIQLNWKQPSHLTKTHPLNES